MARAIEWAISRDPAAGGEMLVGNAGSDAWNYQVKDLAEAVAAAVPGTSVSINREAPPDKRSYRVDFSLFRRARARASAARDARRQHRPACGTVWRTWASPTRDFRNSSLIRLKTLDQLIARGAAVAVAALAKPSGGERRGMKFVPTPLDGAYLIELEKRGDHRGFFARFFCEREFAEAGLETRFVQVNNSLTAARGTLRGMHFQLPPAAEVKLVRCIRGALHDVIVDLRPDSPTYLNWFGADLTAENRVMMYVPRGFAHGFITLVGRHRGALSGQRILCPGT